MEIGRAVKRLGAVALLVAVSTGCGRAPPEQRLRETIDALHEAVERKDAAGVRDLLADDFVGPDALDRDGVRRMAQVLFLRHGHVGANTGPVAIQMTPGHATARFSVAMTGGSGQLLPDAARLYEVETGWREQDGEWRLISARWEARL
ncbi:nuclear transport factor 2 family protein [Lysobacter sp. LF1]|uniref:Nuclear transport factor 2 family protein n=1 Tax=Lysobacter stagni TaxID=3045172 RepID=A0ABT6XIS5_9GAMM|nr:nuclear transport factor 2 family protein [Lysobacter sp. LF1]MDI9240054.1 nuclear transport factor 2 family protein [Lysobacter sp. LF1]